MLEALDHAFLIGILRFVQDGPSRRSIKLYAPRLRAMFNNIRKAYLPAKSNGAKDMLPGSVRDRFNLLRSKAAVLTERNRRALNLANHRRAANVRYACPLQREPSSRCAGGTGCSYWIREPVQRLEA